MAIDARDGQVARLFGSQIAVLGHHPGERVVERRIALRDAPRRLALVLDPFAEAIAHRHRGALRQHRGRRSEEHTSELQSLMRISYAVFCLKKKRTNKTKTNTAVDSRKHTLEKIS